MAIGAAGVVWAAADSRLIQAVRNRDVQSVRALLNQRVDANAPQGDGSTALHWAAHVDDVAIADLLLRAGARANVANDEGATPLHLACTNRSAPNVPMIDDEGRKMLGDKPADRWNHPAEWRHDGKPQRKDDRREQRS